MEAGRTSQLLRQALEDLDALEPQWNAPATLEWQARALALLERVFGTTHGYPLRLRNVRFVPTSSSAASYWFESGRNDARAILKAALFEVEELTTPATIASESAIDAELWEHVHHLLEAEDWAKVASQTAIYVEDRCRTWAGLPAEVIGADLMTAIFKPAGGVFPLGITAAEKEGWHQFARGLSAACRNVDAHRIQTRPDLKAYAIGVLGAGSLLLTQLRFQHGNSFQV